DIALIAGLYIVLRKIDPFLALLALGWGLIETAVLVMSTLDDLGALRLLSNPGYLAAFEPGRLQALARLSLGTHGSGYNLGLIFTGLRSTVFAWLWFESRYIPRALAGLGL